MTYWEIQRQEETLDVFLPNKKLSNASHRDGINPVTIRKAFAETADSKLIMQLVAKDGLSVVTERQQITDLLFWSCVPIFSERARNLAMELGCEGGDFWPCGFKSNPGEIFFIHLPERSYDVVDVAQSRFLMLIPMPDKPPVPHNIQSLVLRASSEALPPCFRALVPGHSQVFSELIVSEAFKQTWAQMGFSGAQYRLLTKNAEQ